MLLYFAVWNCSVSPTGDKLYIIYLSHDKLLVLARDGSVHATFTDPEQKSPYGVHVTAAGQMLVVCNHWSINTILQVESEGKRKFATLQSNKD